MQEQHPVPQQISSYQFRLVGDMTLKQFFELAGGALVGLLIYTTSIPPLFKWPLIIISVLFGVALAFLPIEDRPLEIWVVAFFRSIYSPTIFYWSKSQKTQYFQPEGGQAPPLGVIAPRGQEELNKYLDTKPDSKIPFFAKLEEAEKGFLAKTTSLFGQLIPSVKPAVSTTASIPTDTPATTTISSPTPIEPKAVTPKPQVEIPQTKFIKVATDKTKDLLETVVKEPMTEISVTPTLASQQPTAGVQQAQYSISASPPIPPTQPNTLAGQVMDASGRIIEGAILEMRDSAGRPVRAVKTNKLGHFFIVTPLSDGTYEIITEKDGYVFDPISFLAEGNLIPPIAIRSKQAVS